MDFIKINNGRLSVHGTVAQRLQAAGMNVNVLRPWEETKGKNAGKSYINVNGKAVQVNTSTLRKDEWKQYDQAIIEVAKQRLIGIRDLQTMGLTYNITNGMGKTVLEHETMSDMEDAELSMDGKTRGEKDRVEYGIDYLPLPIIHKDFSINARTLAASRTTGDPLDVTQAQIAGRKVAEKIESMLFTGASSYAFGGGVIRGYLDFPNRNTYSLTYAWTHGSATGETILADVLGMKAKAIAAGFYGPFMLYIPTAYETVLDEDFKAGSDKSIRQRLMEVSSLRGIQVADKLTAANVTLVQMTSDVVRVVNGLGITVVEWSTEGNMVHNFKVMAIQIPQIRSNHDDACGVVHGS